MKVKNTSLVFFFFLILSFIELRSQYTPFFQNYELTEFNAGNQNWGVSVAENGKVYVANDNGLVTYDGLKWSFFQLPNKTIIRSVFAHGDRIYTGSYEEFGYWKKNEKGELLYTSLSNLGDQKESLDEEFWQILLYKGSIVFRSFSNLYVYKNGKVTKIKPESTIISCSVVDGKLYVSTLKNGLFLFEDEKLLPFFYEKFLFNTKIIAVTKVNGKLLINTALKGCYTLENEELIPWNPPVNAVLKEHQLNSFLELANGDMVFGTIKNGLYVANKGGEVLYHLNKENGLLNNTVLSQGVGQNNKLWVGLDNGVSLVNLDNNHVIFNDNSGKLGAVYDIINYKEALYIGSNTGLFYLNKGDSILEFIEESQGQVWELKEINGELFCGHNSGTYLVKNKKLKKVSDFTGGWIIKKVPEKKNMFIQGTYAGLVRYKLQNGNWSVKHLGVTTKPIKYLAFEDTHTAWVAHAYKGLYRVKFSENYESVLEVTDYKNKGLLSDYNVRVYNIKNDICFKTNLGWQKYEALLDSIVSYPILNSNLGRNTNIISETNSDVFVTKNKKDEIRFVSLGDAKKTANLKLPSNVFKKRLVVDSERVSRIKDSIYALNLYGGFILLDETNYIRRDSLYKPIVEQIEIDKELQKINRNDGYELTFNNNISISVSSPNSEEHFFEYTFVDLDPRSWYKIENGKLELSGLGNGDYKVHFRTSNISGESSEITTVNFVVLPPWYKSKALYGTVALLLALLFYGLHKRKVRKEQKSLHNKLKMEQEVLLNEKAIENEKKIVQLKNESLKNEVKLKSKQLANTAMALVKKNESMLEIKSELIKNKIGFENTLLYKRLLRKIDNSIGHEDEWQLFEYNFNQVHEEFFNQLKSKHSNLTHKDLKICAYIKMNLLTKEIAPLMNVSIRGLETHRYRLKRKLNLENDKSLGDYLRNFK